MRQGGLLAEAIVHELASHRLGLVGDFGVTPYRELERGASSPPYGRVISPLSIIVRSDALKISERHLLDGFSYAPELVFARGRTVTAGLLAI